MNHNTKYKKNKKSKRKALGETEDQHRARVERFGDEIDTQLTDISSILRQLLTINSTLESKYNEAHAIVDENYDTLKDKYESLMNSYIESIHDPDRRSRAVMIKIKEERIRDIELGRKKTNDSIGETIQKSNLKIASTKKYIYEWNQKIELFRRNRATNNPLTIADIIRVKNELILKYGALETELMRVPRIVLGNRMLSVQNRDLSSGPSLFWKYWKEIEEFETIKIDQTRSFLDPNVPITSPVYIVSLMGDKYFCVYLKQVYMNVEPRNPDTPHSSKKRFFNSVMKIVPHYGIYSVEENRMLTEAQLNLETDLYNLIPITIKTYRNHIVMAIPRPEKYTQTHGYKGCIQLKYLQFDQGKLKVVATKDIYIPDNGVVEIQQYTVGGIYIDHKNIKVCFNIASLLPVSIFNWNLERTRSIGQRESEAEPYYFPKYVSWYHHVELIESPGNKEYYIMLDDKKTLWVIYSRSGLVGAKLSFDYKPFDIFSANILATHINDKTIVYMFNFTKGKLTSLTEFDGLSKHATPFFNHQFGRLLFVDVEKKLFLKNRYR